MSLGYIISPAKKMNLVEGPPYPTSTPRFLASTQELMETVQKLSFDEAKAVWKCSDTLAQLNYERFSDMNLKRDTTAAILAYEGIQYQHLAPSILEQEPLDYLEAHLRILSGFYGILRPSDGVVAYRLEMQAKLATEHSRDLYGFWGSRLAEALAEEFDMLINLASVEYAKAVVPYCSDLNLPVLTCLFGKLKDGKLIQRSTEAKAARGSFCRWCAEHAIEQIDDMRAYCERGYRFDEELSDDNYFVFVEG
ncbi:MAG: peroxide stress protein YaaA [Atopobiaceae bacterium]|nr:peroxide stress protein YaaA [Atopobiaceae bacterium]